MPLQTDTKIDRDQLKRHLSYWRTGALVLLVILFAVVVGKETKLGDRRHVALLEIEGFILSNPNLEKAVYDLVTNTDAVALVVYINSPGGETAASEAIYRALREVQGKIPVAAVMGGVAASGGYMAAIAADRIFARESTITGSIGVLLKATNIVGLMDRMGVENETIRSGPLKSYPNPLERLTPSARAVSQKLVDDVHSMFKEMIVERRGLEPGVVDGLADGRVYSGRTAIENGLIDDLGGVSDARHWLEKAHAIPISLPEKRLATDDPVAGWLDWLLSRVSPKTFLAERLGLDGLVSVWQPSYTVK